MSGIGNRKSKIRDQGLQMDDMPLPWLLESGGLAPEEEAKVHEEIRWLRCGGALLGPSVDHDEDGDEEGSGQGEKWDCLVLTAMNEKHKRMFELQLEDVPWQKYARKCVVVQDPPGARAGSGGGTVWVLKENRKHAHFDADGRVLLIHSGGYSQRTPHLSNVGKVFMATPQDTTILQLKLHKLRKLLPALRAGILIAASDTLESIPRKIAPLREDVDCLLLMHRSPLKVAENHGVYVVDGSGELVRAMHTDRKSPVLAQLQAHEGAVREEEDADPWCYTDSAFFLSSKLATKLVDYVGNHAQIEICAYRDFLRPLGTEPEPLTDALNGASPDMVLWLCSLNACFNRCNTQLVDCGPGSFCHFGSIDECRRHFYSELGGRAIPIHSTWDYKTGADTIVEYCSFARRPYTVIGDRSIVSCCFAGQNRNHKEIVVPVDVVVYSTPVERDGRKGWVTVVLGTADDVKRAFAVGAVLWSGTTLTDYEGTSLWEAPLFTMTPGAEKSLCQSLRKYKHRATDPEVIKCCGWSMADVVRYVDVERLVEYRRARKALWWIRGPDSLGEPMEEEEEATNHTH